MGKWGVEKVGACKIGKKRRIADPRKEAKKPPKVGERDGERGYKMYKTRKRRISG